MNTLRCSAHVALLLVASCKPTQSSVPIERAAQECPDTQPTPERPDPAETVRAYLDATTAGDLDQAAALIRDESVVFESGGNEGTWAHYRDHHLGPEIDMFKSFDLRTGEMRVSASDDASLALVTAPIEYDILLINDRQISSVGTVTFALRYEADRYTIEHIHWSSRPKRTPKPKDPVAVEQAAFTNAKPAFDRHCAGCHSKGQPKSSKKAMKHFDMTSYPFGGHHAADVDATVRKALGVDGGKASMPPGKAAGSVQGDDLAAIVAWTEAFAAAKASGAHGDKDGHDGHGGHEH